MRAILELGGKQLLVEPGVKIRTEEMPDRNIGDQFELDKVLCVYGDTKTIVGTPHVPGATVKFTVTGRGRGRKIDIRTYRDRKASKRTMGHRQDYIELKVDEILAD